MKQLIFSITLSIIIMIGSILSSCQSPSQKVEDAQVKVDDAKKDLKEVQKDANTEAQKAANAEEMKAFRSETDLTIKNYEMQIGDLKDKMKKSGKKLDAVYQKNIDVLEQKIKDLKIKLDNYEKNQSDWQSFKREFNHDMDELGKALKDLTVNNKK